MVLSVETPVSVFACKSSIKELRKRVTLFTEYLITHRKRKIYESNRKTLTTDI